MSQKHTVVSQKKKKNRERMAFRMANQFRRSAMKSRNFASAAAASEKGFVEKFVPVEVFRALIVARRAPSINFLSLDIFPPQ
jgi:hypothetical protein